MALRSSKIFNFITVCTWKEKMLCIAIPDSKYNNINTAHLIFSPFTISGAFNIRWKLWSYTLLDLVTIHPSAKVRAPDQVYSLISVGFLCLFLFFYWCHMSFSLCYLTFSHHFCTPHLYETWSEVTPSSRFLADPYIYQWHSLICCMPAGNGWLNTQSILRKTVPLCKM